MGLTCDQAVKSTAISLDRLADHGLGLYDICWKRLALLYSKG